MDDKHMFLLWQMLIPDCMAEGSKSDPAGLILLFFIQIPINVYDKLIKWDISYNQQWVHQSDSNLLFTSISSKDMVLFT